VIAAHFELQPMEEHTQILDGSHIPGHVPERVPRSGASVFPAGTQMLVAR